MKKLRKTLMLVRLSLLELRKRRIGNKIWKLQHKLGDSPSVAATVSSNDLSAVLSNLQKMIGDYTDVQ